VQLTIDSAEQPPAAEAVISAKYGVPDAISSLEQHQAVHALVMADMVHAEAAGQQALQVLQAAAKSEQRLTAAAMQALAALPVWPSCLLRLLPTIVEHAPCFRDNTTYLAAVTAADAGGRVHSVLVAALGDLQAVWSDKQLQQLLMGLPLPAMQLLLSADQLRVPSQDTVLYTAKQYVEAQPDDDSKAAAEAALAPLVRAPQLSMFALSCAALPADSGKGLLGAYVQQLKGLLSLKRIASPVPWSSELTTAVKEHSDDAPDSWQLGPRRIKQLDGGVRLEWRLPVEQLSQACRDSCARQKTTDLFSTSSGPLGGAAWRLYVCCRQVNGGTEVGLYAGAVLADMPVGIFCRFKYTASWQGKERTIASPCLKAGKVWGCPNFFGLQPMAGDGWDESVWAAAGLPTSGDMLLELCVHSVE
jgi:hypothetical protein